MIPRSVSTETAVTALLSVFVGVPMTYLWKDSEAVRCTVARVQSPIDGTLAGAHSRPCGPVEPCVRGTGNARSIPRHPAENVGVSGESTIELAWLSGVESGRTTKGGHS